MLEIILNLTEVNTSLQVGDLIYARGTSIHGATGIATGTIGDASTGTGSNHLVGILRRIQNNGSTISLMIDASMLSTPFIPTANQFLMFSKYSQGDAGVSGYYAKAKLVNNSTEKAEIFAVSSEIIINSK
jgi:hypothetical protein